MKFKIKNVGPISEAEIELGDFTLFLGPPSTGKSFSLRSIYSSLIVLDDNYLGRLRETTFIGNAGAIGIDYITAYLDSLLALGNNVCDKDLINEILNVVKGLGYNVKSTFSPTQNGCSVTLVEEVNPKLKINEIIDEASYIITQNVTHNLEYSVLYESSSSIEINGEETKKLIERIKPTFNVKQGQVSFSLSDFYFSEGKRKAEVTINNKGNVFGFIVNLTIELPSVEQSSRVDVTKKDIINAFAPGSPYFHKPFIFGILDPGDVLPKEVIKKILKTEYNSVTFIPYNRTQLVLSYNNLQRERMDYLRVARIPVQSIFHYIPEVLQSPDFSVTSYILHFDYGVKKLVDKENEENVKHISEIIDVIHDLVKIKMEVVRLTPAVTLLRYRVENKEIEPFYASAMVNEITSILLPLADVQTPALVLIEELESQLHLAYQILLLLVMLSLVQHGYKFVITTHADLMTSFLGNLVEYQPSKEKIMELLENIFGQDIVSSALEKIIEDVEKTIKGSKIKAYYFENGTAREVPANRLANEVPGVTRQVIDKVVDWEWKLKENK